MNAPVQRLFAPTRPDGLVVITGGCGFIGSNLAEDFLKHGEDVLLVDDLSRSGVDQNLAWLQATYGDRVHACIADVRDLEAIVPPLREAKAVFHLAAQTAVTTSLAVPTDDFEINARGTLNVLEAVRRSGRRVPVIFAGTNKVYGGLEDIDLAELETRRDPVDAEVRTHGIGETRSLDFCTPYGCSKGVADQYVLDYARSFDLPTAVLRMSCIYGPRQFGTEDQGWVAHFLLRALARQPITIYGDGKQVRDVLHVDDAVAAYRAVLSRIDELQGQVFNLGGGPGNAVSLRSLLTQIARIVGREVEVSYDGWRQGDQLYFVADTRKLEAATGWRSHVRWQDGLHSLAAWLAHNRLGHPLKQRSSIPA
jgi:CDP-paratose 2-epimerase